MIKFLIEHPETKRIIYGMVITKRNVELLQQAKPIHINAEQLNMPFIKFEELLLMYYETDDLAIKDLTEKGYLTKDTKIEIVTQSKAM